MRSMDFDRHVARSQASINDKTYAIMFHVSHFLKMKS